MSIIDRRAFLTAACATVASPDWAEAGAPGFLAAARKLDGSYALCGLDGEARTIFEIGLPDRGHAAAARPGVAEAVAFARRPGTFALVIDCAEGREIARLGAPEGRHLYGHGAFSADGTTLYTTENAYDTGDGRIGVWDATDGYRRIGEISSGGIGPHDLKMMPDGETLLAANGGIRTHPDYGREKLNLATMRSNLSYISKDGGIVERVEPPAALRRNSIRHLAVRQDGLVAAAMQWEGPKRSVVPLLALHRATAPLRMLKGPDQAALKGYAASVAFSGDGSKVAITAPRGGTVQIFDTVTGQAVRHSAADACGIATATSGFLVTTGEGRVLHLAETSADLTHSALRWDNHLVPVEG